MSYPLYPADPTADPAAPFRNLDPAPTTGSQPTVAMPSDTWNDTVDSRPLSTEEVIERQREQFGGVKVGSAFFGWLTATGLAALLTGLLAATGAALGLGVIVTDPGASVGEVPLDAQTIGWIGGGALLAILLLAYYCGGYVTGRMARFNGVRQGLAVWVWALVMAIVIALISVGLGSQYDILGRLNAFPRIPVSDGELTIAGIITAIVVAVASLGGAILGGVVGVRYHRRVDHAGLDD